MRITISGRPGAGKGSLKDMLSYEFKIPAYSMGDIRGMVAQEMGVDIDELNKIGEYDPNTDEKVDDMQRKLGEEETDLILEGRLSWYFVPNSFKIFLDVQEYIGAERILKSGRQDEIIEEDLDLEVKRLRERISSDCLRYQKWHGIDFSRPKKECFDCWIDTSFLSREEVFDKVVHEYVSYLKNFEGEVKNQQDN